MQSNLSQIIQEKFSEIAEHPDLDLRTIELYPHAPWDRYKLSHHPNFTLAWMREMYDFSHEDHFYPSNWDWNLISQHPDIDDNFLFDRFGSYHENNLNFQLLSKHPNFKCIWMNRYIGAQWDLDFILQREDFTQDDLLKLFLRPTQKWNFKLIAERFGKEWCKIFIKIQKKMLGSVFEFADKVEWKDVYENSVSKWFDPAFNRIVNCVNGGWNDMDDNDNFDLIDYFKHHEEFAALEFKKERRHRKLESELLPIAWHPGRWWDWCVPEDEKKEISLIWSTTHTTSQNAKQCSRCKKLLDFKHFNSKKGGDLKKCCNHCLQKSRDKRVLSKIF